MFSKHLGFLGLIVILLYFAGTPLNRVLAKDINSEIAMVTMDQIPYGFVSADGKHTGVLYDILNEIIRESDVGRINEITPPQRVFLQMISNKKTCSLVADLPSVVSNLDLIELIGYEVVFGILPKSGNDLIGYKDLTNLTIGIPLGMDVNDYIKNDIIFSIVSPPKYINAIRMMKKGRVDGVAGNLSALKYIARAEGMTAADFGTPFILQRNNVYLVCTSIITKESRQKLKKAVIKLKENGTIKTILKRYFNESDF